MWCHLKCIVHNRYASRLFLWLANACLQSGHWPAEFKASTTVVIPKPGKLLYDTPKSFCPIVLLNTLGKMFEKMLSIGCNLKQPNMEPSIPTSLEGFVRTPPKMLVAFLLMLSKQDGVQNSSMVAFDLAQFFPSINHDVLLSILDKQGFVPEVVVFFKSYLVD
jgi:hypothetical protein